MPKNQAQTNLFERPTTRLLGLHKRTESEAKHEGMEAAADKAPDHGYDLDEVRTWCRRYIYLNQSLVDLSMDDRRRLQQSENIIWADPVREHEFSFGQIQTLSGTDNNCLGSLFPKKHPDPSKCFVWTGEYINSKTEGAHCRPVKTWTLPKYKI